MSDFPAPLPAPVWHRTPEGWVTEKVPYGQDYQGLRAVAAVVINPRAEYTATATINLTVEWATNPESHWGHAVRRWFRGPFAARRARAWAGRIMREPPVVDRWPSGENTGDGAMSEQALLRALAAELAELAPCHWCDCDGTTCSKCAGTGIDAEALDDPALVGQLAEALAR